MKVAVAVASDTVTSLMEKPGRSLSGLMVMVWSAWPSSAPPVTPERLAVNVSVPSPRTSLMIGTVMVWVAPWAVPAAKVRVPGVAV